MKIILTVVGILGMGYFCFKYYTINTLTVCFAVLGASLITFSVRILVDRNENIWNFSSKRFNGHTTLYAIIFLALSVGGFYFQYHGYYVMFKGGKKPKEEPLTE